MPTTRPAPPSPVPAASAVTTACYLAYGLLGWIMSGMGATLPDLRNDLGGIAGVYPALPGAGLLVLGLLAAGGTNRRGPGRHAGPRSGRSGSPQDSQPDRVALHRSITLLCLTAVAGLLTMVAAPWPLLSLAGALALGLAAAALIRLVPTALSTGHPGRSIEVLTRGNAWSSLASIAGPLTIGATTWIGLGWRPGLVLAPLAAAVALLALRSRNRARHGTAPTNPNPPDTVTPETATPAIGTTGAATPAIAPARPEAGWGWAWAALTLSIVVEFAFVYFAATYLREEIGMSPAASATGAAAFAVGMAVGRFGAGSLAGYARQPLRFHLAVLTAGFVLMWALPSPATAVVGIALAGLGTALLYPIGIDRLLVCFSSAPFLGASRGGLASGIALLASPTLLGILRAAVGIRFAYLAVPALLAVLAVIDTMIPAPLGRVTRTGTTTAPVTPPGP